MKKENRSTLFLIGFLIAMALVFLSTLCCCGFRPYENKDATPEYNMAINAMKLADRTKNVLVAEKPIENFYSSLKRDKCRKEVFGCDEQGNINPVDYTDTVKYRNYNECLKELK